MAEQQGWEVCSFESIDNDETNKLRWINEPTKEGGNFSVKPSGELSLFPEPKRDIWKRTFYKPELIKDDAACLFGQVASNTEATLDIAFSLKPQTQFDQAGAVVRLDSDHQIKTGIEFVDGTPMLSCVVTNVFSDWSTQPWSDWHHGQTSIRIRVHKINQGSSVVVEACPFSPTSFDKDVKQLKPDPNTPPATLKAVRAAKAAVVAAGSQGPAAVSRVAAAHLDVCLRASATATENTAVSIEVLGTARWVHALARQNEGWQMVRICHLSSKITHGDLAACGGDQGVEGDDHSWRVGVFGACPVDQKGCEVVFHHIGLTSLVGTLHGADL